MDDRQFLKEYMREYNRMERRIKRAEELKDPRRKRTKERPQPTEVAHNITRINKNNLKMLGRPPPIFL